MDFELDEDEALLATMAEKFTNGCTSGESRWIEMAEMGWLGCHLDEAAGGAGLGMSGAAILMQAIGRAGLSDGMLGHSILGATALAGSPRHAELLSRALAGDLKLGAAFAEADFRHDLGTQATTATRTDAGWKLDGVKAPTLGCRDAGLIVVSAVGPTGDACFFAVPADAPGLNVLPYPGPDERDVARLSLKGVAVAEGDRIEADPALTARLQAALHIALAADSCGAMHRLTQMTRTQLETRQQFGRAIGTFQALQHRYTDMHVALDEARALMLAAAMATDAGASEAPTLARKAWVQACWSGRRIAEEAVQMHGAIGMTSECQVGFFVKRLTANIVVGGHADLHLGMLAAQAE
ncbi:acyl-CoA dehydrogenase family protein [Arenibacterium halophilum]|uniref:Acyl-CoA dehydrogenase n=1 Tax=Arenibacterium halophilum TaxID=2583821 RepID=A0ABY2XAW0_9RHOB|nr:acyl-CoA dehydrogenase family protein [Arenibacterium halophilum]TMV13128.1 hypothetical protein FGK64_10145 [Arenibacterium halophilum]